MNSLVILAFTGLASMCQGANILMLEPMPTMSHYHLFDKLAIQLAKKGHKVTLLSPFQQSRAVPNLMEVQLNNVYDSLMSQLTESTEEKSILTRSISPWKGFFLFPKMSQLLSDNLLESPSMRKFLEKDQKFDLLIAENFLVESLTAGLAFKYGLPVIAVVPFMPNYWSNHLVGNPAPTSFVPDPILGYTAKMTFFERFSNTLYLYMQILLFHFFHFPSQDAIMRKHFGSEAPYILDILRNTSLALVNHHFSLAYSRPYVPNMIEIGGYHVPAPGQLPQDLQRILDEAKDGAILFSMGSHLKSKDMPKKMIGEIMKVFAKLKQTILWKFEDESLKNLPQNVIIRKWFPQSDILAHPNLKLFISHGGLLSTTESVYRGVPVVGIPVMGDQPINMKQASEAGFAVVIPILKLDEENLYAAINEVLSNPKYAERAKKCGELLRDRPVQPMDLALYWIEYVIRHKGAHHLRSPAQDLTWYEIQLLDVFAALSVLLFALISMIYFIVRFLRKVLCNTSLKKESVSLSKKKN